MAAVGANILRHLTNQKYPILCMRETPCESLIGLFETGPVIILKWDIEEFKLFRKCMSVTPNIQALTGYAADEFCSLSFLSLVHPLDRHLLFETFVDKPLVRQRIQFRISSRLTKSSFTWVEMNIYVEQNVLCYLIDIDNLKLKEEQLNLVLEGTRLGMWDWNPQTNEVRYNERWAQLFGYTMEELVSKVDFWTTRVHPDDMATCFEQIQQHLKGETDFYENVHRMRHKDGHWIYVLDRGKVVERDILGRPIRVTGTYTDISTQKIAEEQAKEALNTKNSFLANISHELRTPLNGIIGVIDLLKQMDPPDSLRTYLAIMDESSGTLSAILNDLLDLFKLDSGKVVIELRPVLFREAIHDILSVYLANAVEKNINMELVTDINFPEIVQLDKVRFGQVLANLVSNSIKFTNSNGNIFIRSRFTPDEKILVEVSDTGIGIGRDKLEEVFEPFVQAEIGTTRLYGGTGLGLPICKQLVGLMEGEMSVESKLGFGSTFTFTVQSRIGGEEVSLSEQPVEYNNIDFSEFKVLVAEDNKVNLFILTTHLSKLGIKPRTSKNGLEALNIAKEHQFDLIFMDLHMPQMNGIDSSREILEYYKKVKCPQPLIFGLSADVSQDSVTKSKLVGIRRIIPKPFVQKDLIVAFEELRESRTNFMNK